MYTFHQLANIDDTHSGFYAMTCIILVILVMIFSQVRDYGWSTVTGSIATAALLIWTFVGYNSFTTSTAKTMANTPVTAKFVQYVPEQQRYSCMQGKIQSTCYTSKVYAQFEVDGGMMVMEVSGQYPIPPLVQMYRN